MEAVLIKNTVLLSLKAEKLAYEIVCEAIALSNIYFA